MKKFLIPLLMVGCFQYALQVAAASNQLADSDTTSHAQRTKPDSEGNWGGLSFSNVSMAMFQGDLEDYSAQWGGVEGLGLALDDISRSRRIEVNPFEYRQRILGEFIAITTGFGFDWWHVAVDPNIRLDFDETLGQVVGHAVEATSSPLNKNRLDVVYLRMPILASVRSSRSGDRGMHVEAGFVGGYRIFNRYFQSYQENGSPIDVINREFPTNPFQIHAHVAVGFGSVSLLAEASLLPFFQEQRNPEMHSLSLGLHFAFNNPRR